MIGYLIVCLRSIDHVPLLVLGVEPKRFVPVLVRVCKRDIKTNMPFERHLLDGPCRTVQRRAYGFTAQKLSLQHTDVKTNIDHGVLLGIVSSVTVHLHAPCAAARATTCNCVESS